MHTSTMDTEQLKALIKDKIQHAYLDKHIQTPIINEEKLTILSLIINNTTMSESKKRQYIITTMLVQIALDTHDLVPGTNSVAENEVARTEKQLTVLAGDFFSGLYYLLLSEIEAFDMIHILASVIKEINEWKMKLYFKEVDSFQEYISIVKRIESLLIIRVADHVDNSIMKSISGDLLLTSKLIQEKRKIPKKDSSPILDTWFRFSPNSSYSHLISTIESIIESNTNQIEKNISDAPTHLSVYKTHIRYALNDLLYNTSVAEEG